MNAIKEIKGLKCPNHDYVRDNYNFTYEPSYPGARPLSGTRCIKGVAIRCLCIKCKSDLV